MARTARNSKLDTRSARLKLAARREPYWTALSSGCHIGYRRTPRGGTWIGRYRDNATGKRHFAALGPADDIRDADGITVFSFAHAQARAREFFDRKAREMAGDLVPDDGKFTVEAACNAYMVNYARRGGRGSVQTQSAINSHILPALGSVAVAKLTRKRVADWVDGIAGEPPRVRGRKGADKPAFRKAKTGADSKRQRKSTANRVLTVLKAALNFVHGEGLVSCRPVWSLVKPYRAVDAARLRYLSDDEARRLVNACEPEFRDLVKAALVTGCRYGELAAFTVEDLNPDAGAIRVRTSKSGKPRHVYLTDEGQTFFGALARRRKPRDFLLKRPDDKAWRSSDQQRPLARACKAARLSPLTFHELRHTYASRLVMRGAPLPVVARQLGHSDTRMVEKHYGHMAPSYVADTVRAAFGPLGFAPDKNVVALAKPKRKARE
jgi:integrase